jgi:hypothetical protein
MTPTSNDRTLTLSEFEALVEGITPTEELITQIPNSPLDIWGERFHQLITSYLDDPYGNYHNYLTDRPLREDTGYPQVNTQYALTTDSTFEVITVLRVDAETDEVEVSTITSSVGTHDYFEDRSWSMESPVEALIGKPAARSKRTMTLAAFDKLVSAATTLPNVTPSAPGTYSTDYWAGVDQNDDSADGSPIDNDLWPYSDQETGGVTVVPDFDLDRLMSQLSRPTTSLALPKQQVGRLPRRSPLALAIKEIRPKTYTTIVITDGQGGTLDNPRSTNPDGQDGMVGDDDDSTPQK